MYSVNWALEHSVTALRLRASLNMFSSKLLVFRVTSASLPLRLLCSPLLYITVWSAPRLFAVYMLPGGFIWKDNFLEVYTLHGFTKPPVPWQLQISFFTSWSPELRELVFTGTEHSIHTGNHTTLWVNSSLLPFLFLKSLSLQWVVSSLAANRTIISIIFTFFQILF